MPTISFTLSANDLTRVQDTIAALYLYQPIIDGLPNPESKAEFTKKIIANLIRDKVRNYEKNITINQYINQYISSVESSFSDPSIT